MADPLQKLPDPLSGETVHVDPEPGERGAQPVRIVRLVDAEHGELLRHPDSSVGHRPAETGRQPPHPQDYRGGALLTGEIAGELPIGLRRNQQPLRIDRKPQLPHRGKKPLIPPLGRDLVHTGGDETNPGMSESGQIADRGPDQPQIGVADAEFGSVLHHRTDQQRRNSGGVETADQFKRNVVIVEQKTVKAVPGNRVIVEESWPTGELKRLSGADTYTQEWTWDPVWGTQATLTTWKEDTIPQVTTWVYNNRGFNTAKQYADNTGPTYTYDADGNLLTRTWARGVVTTYTYDAAGRMTEQSYSDDTPSITASYNFLNQPITIVDAAGSWTFVYNMKAQLEREIIPSIVNNLNNNYSYDVFGRKTLRQLEENGIVHASSSIFMIIKGA